MTGRVTLRDLDRREDGPLLTTSEVASVMRKSESTVRALAEAKEIRGFRIGRNWRFLWPSVRAYLTRCGVLPLRGEEAGG